jgi:hypothetical protein
MGLTHYGLCYGMVGRDVGLRRGWHQPTFKGPLEDRLAQKGTASETGLDGGFDLIEDREAAIRLVDDSMLLCQGAKAWQTLRVSGRSQRT